MTEATPTDTMAPWTIKSVPSVTKDAVIQAARKEGLTVGQWLERRVREWTEDGEPTRVASASAPDGLGILERVAAALTGLAAAGVPVPKSHAARLTGALVAVLPQTPRLPAPGRPIPEIGSTETPA